MKRRVTGHQPRVTVSMLRTAQAEAIRRFGADVSVRVVPRRAGVGQHGECVTGPTQERDGHHWYVCLTCPKTEAIGGLSWGTRHPVKAWRDAYQISRPMGAFELVLGSGFSFADAFADADAREGMRAPQPAPPADVPLPAAPRAARMAQAPRSRRGSTSRIPPARRVTGQQPVVSRRRCHDCGVAIHTRTRCNRCALRQWRATHPAAKRTQDQRYRAKRPARVRALVRARVAQWRKRQQKKP